MVLIQDQCCSSQATPSGRCTDSLSQPIITHHKRSFFQGTKPRRPPASLRKCKGDCTAQTCTCIVHRSESLGTEVARDAGIEPSQDSAGPRSHQPTCTAFLTAAAALGLPASPALAAIHAEPTNALSLPTWAIHISSTVEWGTAMLLFWRYAEVTGSPASLQNPLHCLTLF